MVEPGLHLSFMQFPFIPQSNSVLKSDLILSGQNNPKENKADREK